MEGPGQLVTGTVAAATGAEWSMQCPPGERWKVLGITFSLTTSAAVANRVPTIQIRDNALLQTAHFTAPGPQTASQAINYSVNPGGGSTSSSSYVIIPASVEVMVENGGTISSYTAGLDPGDSYSLVNVQFRKWVGL
jgi:hypothetical protein